MVARARRGGEARDAVARQSACEGGSCSRLFFGDLDAPVLRPTLLRPVVGDRLGLAPALRRDPRRGDALRLHVVGDGIGPPLGQTQVVGFGADRIGVALDERAELRVLLHRGNDFRIDPLFAGRLQRRLVEVEVRVGRELDVFLLRRRRRRWWWWWWGGASSVGSQIRWPMIVPRPAPTTAPPPAAAPVCS